VVGGVKKFIPVWFWFCGFPEDYLVLITGFIFVFFRSEFLFWGFPVILFLFRGLFFAFGFLRVLVFCFCFTTWLVFPTWFSGVIFLIF